MLRVLDFCPRRSVGCWPGSDETDLRLCCGGRSLIVSGQSSLYSVETTAAILLRKTKLTESSLIISWFTQDHGRIKTVAKGARQPKSRFAGQLDLFFDCEIQFARSRKSELHILREVVLRNPRAPVCGWITGG